MVVFYFLFPEENYGADKKDYIREKLRNKVGGAAAVGHNIGPQQTPPMQMAQPYDPNYPLPNPSVNGNMTYQQAPMGQQQIYRDTQSPMQPSPMQASPMQPNTIQPNTIQPNTIQPNTMSQPNLQQQNPQTDVRIDSDAFNSFSKFIFVNGNYLNPSCRQ